MLGLIGLVTVLWLPIVWVSIEAVAVPRPGIVPPIVWINVRAVAVTVWRISVRWIAIRTLPVIVVPKTNTCI